MCCATKSYLINIIVLLLTLIGIGPQSEGWVASIEHWLGHESATPVVVLPYEVVGDDELEAHLFGPEGWDDASGLPAVVTFHSSSASESDPEPMYTLCRRFAQLGYVSITFEQRPTAEDPQQLGLVQDAGSAIRWTREHADELAVDVSRIAMFGQPPEWILAAISPLVPGPDVESQEATTGFLPDALILFDMRPQLLDLVESSAATADDTQGNLSLHELIQPGLPPTLLVVRNAASPEELSSAEIFSLAMADAGNECRVELLEGMDLSSNDEANTLSSLAHEFLISLGFWE